MRKTPQHTDEVRPRTDLPGPAIAPAHGTRPLLAISRSMLDSPETGSPPAARPKLLGSVDLVGEAG